MKKVLVVLTMLVTVLAQAWTPTRPITVIVPNSPGAGNELAFRILAKQVEITAKVNFVYDYRPGAYDTVAMNYFDTLPNDGYHVAVPSCQSTYVTAEVWYSKNVRFNAMDFVPVMNMGKSPLGFYARLNSDVDTPEKLIAAVKSGQRPLFFAVGGAAHKLAVEYFVNGIRPTKDTVETVMFKGPAQAMQDVMTGAVEFGVFPTAVGATMVQAGKIKVIGVAGEKVLPGLEQYKLMNRYVPGLNVYACWNLILPKNTSDEVQQWYQKYFVSAINSKETQEFYQKQFIFVTPSELNSAGVRASMHKLREQWQPFARNIKPE